MRLSISAAGMASAQGSLTRVFDANSLRAPDAWPWSVNGWTTSHICRSVAGFDSNLGGISRCKSLVQMALEDCFGSAMPNGDTPIFIGSCNGAADGIDETSWRRSFDTSRMLADTPWAGRSLPVFSASCNSGFHALHAATQALKAGAKEAVVVAVDILSPINQSNFESLRVLSASPVTPWQQNSSGFVLGEAAVVLKLTTEEEADICPKLSGPILTNSLGDAEGMLRVLETLSASRPAVVFGQGTGPSARDQSELAAFQTAVESSVPLSTPLLHFGHTLGASGLLSIALAFMAQRESRLPLALAMTNETASDGRPLVNGSEELKPTDCILLTSGALDGSCAGAIVGGPRESEPDHSHHAPEAWRSAKPPGPLMNPTLRKIAKEALARRPQYPPDVLVVRLHQPLAPPATAWFGGRLLPSAVLEITPGFVSQLIAQCWGFTGPALCMVGESDAEANRWDFVPTCERLGLCVARIELKGTGDNREIIWNV